MMLLGLIPVAASAVLAVGGGGLSRRLSPRLAATMLTVLALATSLSTGAVLCLAAVSALARMPVVAALGGWSQPTARPLEQLPVSWSLLAGAVAAILLAAAIGYAVRAGRELVRASRVCRRLAIGQDRLVIMRDERPTAYTVPAGQGAIVISTGMLRLLSADERRVLLAHEGAHLRYHHACYVMLARLAAAANPLLQPLAKQVRLAIELWADQVAVDELGDGEVVARALARASLAAAGPGGRAAAALTIGETHVQARVSALTGQPPRRYRWAAAAALALIMSSSAAALAVAWNTHQQIEIAQLAYTRTFHARTFHAAPDGCPRRYAPRHLAGDSARQRSHGASACPAFVS